MARMPTEHLRFRPLMTSCASCQRFSHKSVVEMNLRRESPSAAMFHDRRNLRTLAHDYLAFDKQTQARTSNHKLCKEPKHGVPARYSAHRLEQLKMSKKDTHRISSICKTNRLHSLHISLNNDAFVIVTNTLYACGPPGRASSLPCTDRKCDAVNDASLASAVSEAMHHALLRSRSKYAALAYDARGG